MKKISKTLGWIVVCVILLAILAVFGLSALEAYNITHPEKNPTYTYPSELELSFEIERIEGEHTVQYWWIPAQIRGNDPIPSDKTVILVSNYGDGQDLNSINGLYYARYLTENGYNVVTFKSDYRAYSFGDAEVQDILTVANSVRNKTKTSFLAVQGWGFGAAAALQATAKSDLITCAIADSSYDTLETAINRLIPLRTSFPLTGLIRMWMPIVSDVDFRQPNISKTVANMAGKSVFLIHSESDTVFSADCSVSIENALSQNNDTELWKPSDAPHTATFCEQEETYAERTVLFLNQSYRKSEGTT